MGWPSRPPAPIGFLERWKPKASHKGNGFQQPLVPHEHWHVDISYLNIYRDLLLSLLGSGWLFAFPVALGIAHRNDGARRRDRLAASPGKISGYFPTNHHR